MGHLPSPEDGPQQLEMASHWPPESYLGWLKQGSASLGTRLLHLLQVHLFQGPASARFAKLYKPGSRTASKVRGFLPGVHFAGLTQARTQTDRAIALPNRKIFIFSRKRHITPHSHPKYGESARLESTILKTPTRTPPANAAGSGLPAALTASRCFPIIAANRLSSRAREDSTPSNSSEGRDEQAVHRGRRKVRTYSLRRRRTVFSAKTVYGDGTARTGSLFRT